MRTHEKILSLAAFAAMLLGCGGGAKDGGANGSASEASDTAAIAMREIQVGSKVYNIADIDDSARVYKEATSKDRCFMVISKKEYRLYVYEAAADGKDTLLLAHFPVCYAKYAEAKTKSGDMKTPESTPGKPFHIQQIQDASTWHHDFSDGRGSIPSYGNWFLRLETPGFTGVGIHGSTNNEASVPGRDSEGCIRLRDADLDVLHDRYAQTGQAVIIKGIGEGKYPFEERASAALGDRYRGPVAGNKRQSDSPSTAATAEGGSVIKRQEGGAVIKRQGADAKE